MFGFANFLNISQSILIAVNNHFEYLTLIDVSSKNENVEKSNLYLVGYMFTSENNNAPYLSPFACRVAVPGRRTADSCGRDETWTRAQL